MEIGTIQCNCFLNNELQINYPFSQVTLDYFVKLW